MDINDPRKGFKYFAEALNEVAAQVTNSKDWELVIMGRNREELTRALKLKSHSLGFLTDQEMISAGYAACDVFVMPTLEDNLPNTILEALASGVPTVGFKVGGVPQMIDHMGCGYLANEKDSEDLANGLAYVLESDERLIELSKNARKNAVENFSNESIAKQYKAFYNSLFLQSE